MLRIRYGAPDEWVSPHTRIARGSLAKRDPSPGLHLAMQADLSHRGRGAPTVRPYVGR
ncbi:hypothetical protein M2222_007387 [Bradyrhizobium elkanii]|nr:hypothetical protein [Bradyrhizobium elkanii]MCS3565065.1 hypothetical protein [Bradyrhizobium elkanii]MCW2145107.1 hypothetical protein [Bradyrhizobium elkanii]MCW2356076.1 hypothetical protein [Bradyrhizobium elkanii]MCW2377933.1 hypothetical protein [Bradyrhizobium elkanii]